MPEKGLLLNEILANEFFDFSPLKLMPDRSQSGMEICVLLARPEDRKWGSSLSISSSSTEH